MTDDNEIEQARQRRESAERQRETNEVLGDIKNVSQETVEEMYSGAAGDAAAAFALFLQKWRRDNDGGVIFGPGQYWFHPMLVGVVMAVLEEMTPDEAKTLLGLVVDWAEEIRPRTCPDCGGETPGA